ncbi:hypothetical protein F5879DRAFT_695003 [Lentinula edodes]|uniref:uncharacterized protein n=1 Tax=Lentinula edodes TaxID=5353 RepID=UPI001E8D6B1E|nr:uncharacterized protein C8R40DRAFT_679935 [Lentinula edodes]KAH7878831.1 hypothetical protein C8R40DRAFT_679935 [Lentinula edodes]KAJ3878459.1 hypothetical protein F5051DRAFT_230314 [Lentinula edodes]KAJ3905913.1 hypothetical protein F5879DRAFT_695003 [Lentinula edodes]
MRSSLVFVALASTSLARYHAPLDIHQDPESTEAIVFSLSALNNHGAPIPPKSFGSRPGWYLGDDPASADGLPWLRDMDLCASLAQSANAIKCPPIKKSATKTLPKRSVSAAPTTTAATTQSTSTPSYYTIFSGLDGAIEGSGYLTYGLVDTISDCESMCNRVTGCIFINTYHDVNGKNGSPELTCSLYSELHTSAEAINKGGQTQPDGSIDYVTDSDGYGLSS